MGKMQKIVSVSAEEKNFVGEIFRTFDYEVKDEGVFKVKNGLDDGTYMAVTENGVVMLIPSWDRENGLTDESTFPEREYMESCIRFVSFAF